MFAVDLGDERFRVWFKHDINQAHFWGVGATFCHVETLDLDEVYPVSTGVALCSKDDQFEKYEGRRWAFTRALQIFSKEDRAKFWSKYWIVTGFPERA